MNLNEKIRDIIDQFDADQILDAFIQGISMYSTETNKDFLISGLQNLLDNMTP